MLRDHLVSLPPCVVYEDDHLLVMNKPAGWNTHAPSAFAGEGLYEWLKHREPRWANLAIVHRLDKETSGVMVFGKSPAANRSLTEQFAQRRVHKKYLLLTDRALPRPDFTAKSKIHRAGERYASGAQGEWAETRFSVSKRPPRSRSVACAESKRARPEGVVPVLVEAEPLTGRTHQIRVHAAEDGFAILGDTLYGGTPWARVCLHATELTFRHPITNESRTFHAEPDFETDPRQSVRQAIIEPATTDAYRLIHGASDGWPGWYVERLGEILLSHGAHELTTDQRRFLETMPDVTGVYHKRLNRQVRRISAREASPELVQGSPAPARFVIRENGVKFESSFSEGYSVGLFLDQRDNRRRLLTGHVAADFSFRVPGSECRVLNTFAYTCGFSVCAARAGARTTSLDLSKKYLEWGRRNFALNGLDPARHDFIYGDAFDWLKRLAKKGRAFDVVILDPPTFSQSKAGGVFRAARDYGKLVSAALAVLKPDGILFVSTNAAEWKPEDFLSDVEQAVLAARRRIVQRRYVPQPPDFPVIRAEPAYLKTAWLRVA